ncbi:hypothetical protein [Sulfuriferula thiophila]|uniref:hypothetical protein n=1 Tax=Sulfuriferula thiophila TaxID=1781211 RepID=UPI000F60A785|nr:hypothetical protein [Sulfuriferula thiophila]
MTPRFTIPAQDTQLAHPTEMRPKHLQTWLEQLHLSDPHTASSSILSSLAALNRQPLSSDTRLKLLALYWQTIQTQVTMLQRQLSGSMLPLSAKADAHTRLARELLLELGHGYKLVLMDNSTSLLNFRSKPDATPVIYQLLLIQHRILELCYEMYAPVPVGLWLEIHQTYMYAHETGATHTIISEDAPTTVIHAYQQILLIALADPYHLMQGELSHVIELTREYALLCEIETTHTANTNANIFTLNLAEDAPPHITTRLETRTANSSVCFFNTHNLIEHMLFLLAKLEAGSLPASLALTEIASEAGYRNLLSRLIHSWGIPHLRRFNRRSNTQNNIEVNHGLRTIHALLNTTVGNDDKPIDITAASFTAPENTSRNYFVSQWQAVNNSAQGHSLRTTGATPTHIKVGELIAMREKTDEPWNLCVIKWIKNVDIGAIAIGVQLLPPHAHAVSVCNPFSAIKNVQPGMLFPENSALKQGNILLTPHGIYMKNVHMDLITDGTHSIVPGKLVLQTQSFDLFEFTVDKVNHSNCH